MDIYDIQTGFWFRQQTFGIPDIPTGRSDICIVHVAAPDNSSYNIYMVAGRPGYKQYLATEEIWVLTLPTFQWILVYTRPDGKYGMSALIAPLPQYVRLCSLLTLSPRNLGHTCHVIGENLVVIGGMQTQTDGEDVQTCSDTMPADIFNLASQNYTGLYDIQGASRIPPVPSQVASAIGGTSSGGAKVKAPKVWSNVYLQFIFDPSLERPDYTPGYTLANMTEDGATNSTRHGKTSQSAIIGGAVGGAVGGCLLIAVIVALFVIRSRRKKRAQAARSQKQQEQGLVSGLTFVKEEGNTKQSLEPQSARQGEPVELDMNLEPAELAIGEHPAELFAPPPLSEVSASPVSTPGTTSVA